MSKNKKDQIVYLLKIYVPLILVILVGCSLLVFEQFSIETETKKTREREIASKNLELIEEDISNLTEDIKVLGTYSEVNTLAEQQTQTSSAAFINKNPSSYESLAKAFNLFSEHKKQYFQIRYIDNNGNEIVKIENTGNRPIITDPGKLQNKKTRNYFIQGMKLSHEQIFLSRLDLNTENGMIQNPKTPTIRAVTPVIDSNNNKKGVLVLNYRAQKILSDAKFNSASRFSEIFLLNSNGYWLLGLHPDQEWGFQIMNRQQANFGNHEPSLWNTILAQTNGNEPVLQNTVDSGVYTFGIIKPSTLNKNKTEIFSQEKFWLTGSYHSYENLTTETIALARNVSIIGAILIITLGVILNQWTKTRLAQHKNNKKIRNFNEVLLLTNKILRHDLANKFTSIKLAADIHTENHEEIEVLNMIKHSSEEGIDIIKGMKSLEKITNDETGLVDIELLPLLKKLKQRIKTPITINGEETTVKADDALYSVFNNLAENAIRHGKTDKIHIDVKTDEKNVIIKFKDFGTGIPFTIKDKLFNEGFSFGESGNTGIGLYIVKKTIERYGGEVTVEENEPHGAIFKITLQK